jgi:hypothetical protein
MKKLKKLQLNRETLRNLSLDNIATVLHGGTGSWGCSLGCSYGCGGTNNSCGNGGTDCNAD